MTEEEGIAVGAEFVVMIFDMMVLFKVGMVGIMLAVFECKELKLKLLVLTVAAVVVVVAVVVAVAFVFVVIAVLAIALGRVNELI